ncbi:MAG: FAD-binding oxidoreductase [Acidobacteriota bacterium]|nr:FAD-binding oxidoreductase [Acidobacteriota bacterium]
MLLTLPAVEVRRATPQSRVLRLACGGAFPYRAGQSALIGLHGQPDRRHYSLATPPGTARTDQTLEFLVRTDRDGSIGPHLDGVQAGTLVDVEGPAGTFVFPDAFDERACLFVAGGTGIAPIRAMLLHATTLPDVRLALAYSARSSREFAYMRELGDMHGLRRLLTATREAPASWRHARGRINQTRLAGLLESPETLCFVCGPPALVEDVPQALMKLGVEERRIRTEIF